MIESTDAWTLTADSYEGEYWSQYADSEIQPRPAAIAINGLGIGQLAIWAIVVAGIVAICLIALRQMGVAIPGWVSQILWVLIVVFVAILAIRLLMSM